MSSANVWPRTASATNTDKESGAAGFLVGGGVLPLGQGVPIHTNSSWKTSDAAPMAQNIALMRERNWIDIPLVYQNDQRAILTLEKGTPGQRVFEKALAAWGND